MAIRHIKLLMTAKDVGTTWMKSYPKWDGTTLFEMPMYELVVSGKNDAGNEDSQKFKVIRFGILKRKPSSSPSVVGLAEQQTHVIKAWLPNYSVHSAASVEDGAWQVYGSFLIHDGPDDPSTDVFGSIGCVEVSGPTGFVALNDYILSLSGATGADRTAKLKAIGASQRMKITYEKAARPPLKPV